MSRLVPRFAHLGFLLAALPLAACNTNRSAPFAATVPQPMAAAVTMGAQDGNFIMAAAMSDQFEIQSSQLALEKAQRPAVRAYAQQMIDHHTATTQALTQLAAAKGAAMPQALDPTQQRLLAAMQGAGPRTFDATYLRGQVMGHTSTVGAFGDEITSGSDADVKGFAQQNQPMIQQHLQEARRLSGRR